MTFTETIENVGKAVDAVGVAVIVLGAVVAAVLTLRDAPRTTGQTYPTFRRRLGRAILLGLELLVAADIIRTVAVTPTSCACAPKLTMLETKPSGNSSNRQARKRSRCCSRWFF